MPTSINNGQPTLALNEVVLLQGIFPSGGDATAPNSGVQLGYIQNFAGNFAPRGSAFSQGQLLSPSSNTALFSIYGAMYGGDGRTTFALPDLRGELAVGTGQIPGGGNYTQGNSVGSDTFTLIEANLPTDFGGGGTAVSTVQPSLPIRYLINTTGGLPTAGGLDLDDVGVIHKFGGNFAPRGTLFAEGQEVLRADYPDLFAVIGTLYGDGDGSTTFNLPDLRGATPVGSSSGTGTGGTFNVGDVLGSETVSISGNQLPTAIGGGGATLSNQGPAVVVTFLIAATTGTFPSRSSDFNPLENGFDRVDLGNGEFELVARPGGTIQFQSGDGTTPVLAQVIAFAGDFIPAGWAEADGSLQSIAANNALFSLLGTTYGGDGRTTFGLPDLVGRGIIQQGTGPGHPTYRLGDEDGSANVTLTINNIPGRSQTGDGTGEAIIGANENDTLDGAGGNDTLTGNGGNDILDGGADNDTLTGGVGDDTLLGSAGDDNMTGGLGSDTHFGGLGNDTVVFAGNSADYTVTGNTIAATVTDDNPTANDDGTDSLFGVEFVYFTGDDVTIALTSPSVIPFFNEIHYDNVGADMGEAIEIAGLAGTDLTGWSIALYNGTDGTVYDTIALSGVIPDQDDGYGTLSFLRAGIQNGAPDGFALVDDTMTVVEFLSYEGTITATAGPANGMTSTDIGVSEDGATPVGDSLQRIGTGNVSGDFTWVAAMANTFDAVNTGQDFVNEAPVLATNTGSMLDEGATDATTTAELETTDFESGPDDLTYTLDSVPMNGTLFVDGDGSGTLNAGDTVLGIGGSFLQSDIDSGDLLFEHDGSETITDDFQFDVSDGINSIDDQTFTFTIAPVNDPPVIAGDLMATVDEGATVTITTTDLTGDDPDDFGTGLTYSVTGTTSGQVELSTNPNVAVTSFTQDDLDNNRVIFRHDDSETTAADFSVTLADGGEDGAGSAGPATVNLTVNPVNDPPVVATNAGSALNEGATDIVTAAELETTDPDNGPAALTYTLDTTVANGTLFVDLDNSGALDGPEVALGVGGMFTQADIEAGRLTYIHDGTETTADGFQFDVSDGALSVDDQTFVFTIAPINDPPVANDDMATTDEDMATTVTVLGNDTDAEMDMLSVTMAGMPANGSVAVNGDNTITYTPDANFNGADSFTYTITDGALSDTSTVTVTVNPINDAPTIAGITANAAAEFVANGTTVGTVVANDVDTGTTLVYTLSDDAGGRFAINAATGELTVADGLALDFEQAASHAITVDVSDGTITTSATFTITVTDVDSPEIVITDDGGRQIVGDSGDDQLTGGMGDDTLDGGSGADILDGQSGNDVLTGSAGTDTILGDAGDDDIQARVGNDSVNAGSGDDTVRGNGGNDTLDGGNADDRVIGGAGNDSILGNSGNDTLTGNGGSDTLDGGNAADEIRGGADSDVINGNSGADTINGNGGDDAITGGTSQDLIRGGAGDDVIDGEQGADRLLGGNGDDTVSGGDEADRVSGGTGADVFMFDDGETGNTAATADLITDFSQADGDIIDLTLVDADSTTGTNEIFAFIGTAAFSGTAGELRYEQTGGETLITGDTDGDGAVDLMIRLSGAVDLVNLDFAL